MLLLNHALVPTIVLLAVPYQGLGVIQVIQHVVEFRQMKLMKQ